MTHVKRRVVRHFALVPLLTALALTVLSSPALLQPVPGGAIPQAEAVVEGQGILEKIGCLGCAAAIIGGGGASILGLVAILGANPEVVYLCGAACLLAFGAGD